MRTAKTQARNARDSVTACKEDESEGQQPRPQIKEIPWRITEG